VKGKIREPAMFEDSLVVRVDAGPHPCAGMEIPVPRKHARAPVATGDHDSARVAGGPVPILSRPLPSHGNLTLRLGHSLRHGATA
jgi:hypothetical protein